MGKSSALTVPGQRRVEVISHTLPADDNAFIRQRHITGGRYLRKRDDTVVIEIGLLPISRSSWMRGVRAGKYPAPIRLGDMALYRVREIRELLERIVTEDSSR